MDSRFSPINVKKGNYLLVLVMLLIFSLCIIVFANTDNFVRQENNPEIIEIILESTELGYTSEIAGMEYYYAGVKHIFLDSTKDILDPASVIWSINDTSVAEILDNGAIIPKAEGMAIVTAEYQGLQDDIQINVEKGQIKKFEILEKDLSLSNAIYNEKTKVPCELHAMVETSYGKVYEVTYSDDVIWESDNISIVSVDGGFLAIHNIGNVKITATFHGFIASTNVKIIDNKIDSKKIKINKELVVIEDANGTAGVKLQAQLVDGSILDISRAATWESEDPSIAVAYDGRIDAMSEGETIINVSYLDYHKSMKVIVKSSANQN